MADAKAVTALQTLVIGQHLVIDLLAQRGAGYPARDPAKQATQNRPGDAADSNAHRATDYS